MFSSDFPHVAGGRNPLKRFGDALADTAQVSQDRFYRDNFINLMGRVFRLSFMAPDVAGALTRIDIVSRSPKAVCGTHGGLSTGPKTKEGRTRCADAKTIHGRETRQKLADTSSKLGELYELEVMARAAGVIIGPKVRGRTPGSSPNVIRLKLRSFKPMAW